MGQSENAARSRSFWANLIGSRGHAPRAGMAIDGYEKYPALPVSNEAPVNERHREAQLQFARILNVGDLDVLDQTLSDWEAEAGSDQVGWRFGDIAQQMVWNYSAPAEFVTERAGAQPATMNQYIMTLEKAAELMPESPYMAALLAGSYLEAANYYKLIEACAVVGHFRSDVAHELTENLLKPHNPTTTHVRMVAAAWYRLQAVMRGNNDAFALAFEHHITIDPSDLRTYSVHGANVVEHYGDDADLLESTAKLAAANDQSEMGLAGYFLLMSNMLANSNEPLDFVNTEMFEQGLKDALRVSGDTQGLLNEMAYNTARMTKRVTTSRLLSSQHRKTADAMRAVVCRHLQDQMQVLRTDVWNMPEEEALNRLKKLYQG